MLWYRIRIDSAKVPQHTFWCGSRKRYPVLLVTEALDCVVSRPVRVTKQFTTTPWDLLCCCVQWQ